MSKLFESQAFRRLWEWRKKYIPDRNFILILSAVVGIFSGLAAVILKDAVELIQLYLTSSTFDENYYQLAYPVIGLLITVVLARFVYKENLGHAITDILYSISRKSARIHRSKMYSRIITSPFTVGFGGSAGLESPIILTGSAIGSNIAQFFHLNFKVRTLMIGCGTAGVISAIFNTPVAGFIFSIEIILGEVSLRNLVPLLLASVSATLTSQAFLGNDVVFRFTLTEGFEAWDMIFYVGLGITCGLFSLFFTGFQLQAEALGNRIQNSYKKALLGGLILSGLIFLAPPIYGEGYSIIKAVLRGTESELLLRSVLFGDISNEWFFLFYIILIVFLKVVAASITIASGGSGGTLAPSLFIGALLGFAFAQFVNLTGMTTLSEANFALVGMCGVLTGVQYAPLTAIFIIAELTGSYLLFLPLMTVSALSLGTASYFHRHSIYVRELVKRGELIDTNLTMPHLKINQLIETDFKTIQPEAKLADLIQLITGSHHNVYPVINKKERLLGIVTLDDVREIMFDKEKQEKVKVQSLMVQPPTFVRYGETLESVINKFEHTSAWILPVIHEGKYAGFVTKSQIFMYYRQKLIEESLEE